MHSPSKPKQVEKGANRCREAISSKGIPSHSHQLCRGGRRRNQRVGSACTGLLILSTYKLVLLHHSESSFLMFKIRVLTPVRQGRRRD